MTLRPVRPVLVLLASAIVFATGAAAGHAPAPPGRARRWLKAFAGTGSIVYVRNGDLYLKSPDGTKTQRVTWDGATQTADHTGGPGYFSPSQTDSGLIVAIRNQKGEHGYNIGWLWVMNRQGEVIRKFVRPRTPTRRAGRSTARRSRRRISRTGSIARSSRRTERRSPTSSAAPGRTRAVVGPPSGPPSSSASVGAPGIASGRATRTCGTSRRARGRRTRASCSTSPPPARSCSSTPTPRPIPRRPGTRTPSAQPRPSRRRAFAMASSRPPASRTTTRWSRPSCGCGRRVGRPLRPRRGARKRRRAGRRTPRHTRRPSHPMARGVAWFEQGDSATEQAGEGVYVMAVGHPATSCPTGKVLLAQGGYSPFWGPAAV